MRLEKGREFRDDFSKALTHSAVVVPFLSTKSMERMLKHDVEIVDNVLVEWLLSLVCYNNKELQAITHIRILPILLGPPDVNNERRSPFNFMDVELMPGFLYLSHLYSRIMFISFRYSTFGYNCDSEEYSEV